jgi:hypothetical protein
MITIRDNRNGKDYKPQVRDLNIGEFFEYENELCVLVYEGSPTNFVCFNFHTGRAKYFYGIEEVEVVENITVTIENN